jgi:hypothetical protein
MSKIYIGLITGNEIKNITELTSVYSYFDGLAAVDHNSEDGTFDVLNSRKGDGFVEKIPYYSHHGHSMNHFLLNPKIKIGDWILLRDSSERINEEFARNIKYWINTFERNNINTIYQYSKLLMFRRFPHQFFANTPHWGFQGAQPGFLQIDQSKIFEKDEDYCYSVRNKTRDKFHFINAYLRYYLILDTNHLLLGADKAELAGISFSAREAKRLRFLEYLRLKNVESNIESVIEFMKNGLDKEGFEFINSELILNNAYSYNVLGNREIKDEHDHKSLIKF